MKGKKERKQNWVLISNQGNSFLTATQSKAEQYRAGIANLYHQVCKKRLATKEERKEKRILDACWNHAGFGSSLIRYKCSCSNCTSLK